MSDWILVEDEIPDEGQAVIYFFECVGVWRGKFAQCAMNVEHFGTDENGKPYMSNTFYSDKGFLGDDVTHWMPDEGQELPSRPEV